MSASDIFTEFGLHAPRLRNNAAVRNGVGDMMRIVASSLRFVTARSGRVAHKSLFGIARRRLSIEFASNSGTTTSPICINAASNKRLVNIG